MIEFKSMSATELKTKLRTIADASSGEADFKQRISEAAPGLAVTIDFHGSLYMGMAASRHHSGVIHF